jgi:hypothetical protein
MLTTKAVSIKTAGIDFMSFFSVTKRREKSGQIVTTFLSHGNGSSKSVKWQKRNVSQSAVEGPANPPKLSLWPSIPRPKLSGS